MKHMLGIEKSIKQNLKDAQEKNHSLKGLPIKSYTIDMSEIRKLFNNIFHIKPKT